MPDDQSNPGVLLIDLDGCNVDQHGNLTADAKARILEAIKNGQRIVIASQRNPAMMARKAKEVVQKVVEAKRFRVEQVQWADGQFNDEGQAQLEAVKGAMRDDNDISRVLSQIDALAQAHGYDAPMVQVMSGDVTIKTIEDDSVALESSNAAYQRGMDEAIDAASNLAYRVHLYSETGDEVYEQDHRVLAEQLAALEYRTLMTKIPFALGALQHGPVEATDDNRLNVAEYQAFVEEVSGWPGDLSRQAMQARINGIAKKELVVFEDNAHAVQAYTDAESVMDAIDRGDTDDSMDPKHEIAGHLVDRYRRAVVSEMAYGKVEGGDATMASQDLSAEQKEVARDWLAMKLHQDGIHIPGNYLKGNEASEASAADSIKKAIALLTTIRDDNDTAPFLKVYIESLLQNKDKPNASWTNDFETMMNESAQNGSVRDLQDYRAAQAEAGHETEATWQVMALAKQQIHQKIKASCREELQVLKAHAEQDQQRFSDYEQAKKAMLDTEALTDDAIASMAEHARRSKVLNVVQGYYAIDVKTLEKAVDGRPANHPIHVFFKPPPGGRGSQTLPLKSHLEEMTSLETEAKVVDVDKHFFNAVVKLKPSDQALVISAYTEDFFHRYVPLASAEALMDFHKALSPEVKKMFYEKCDEAARTPVLRMLFAAKDVGEGEIEALVGRLDKEACKTLLTDIKMAKVLRRENRGLFNALRKRWEAFIGLDALIQVVKDRQDEHVRRRRVKHFARQWVGKTHVKKHTLAVLHELRVLQHYEKLDSSIKEQITILVDPVRKHEQKYRLVENAKLLFGQLHTESQETAVHYWKVLDAIASQSKDPQFVHSWGLVREKAKVLLGSDGQKNAEVHRASAASARLPTFNEPDRSVPKSGQSAAQLPAGLLKGETKPWGHKGGPDFGNAG